MANWTVSQHNLFTYAGQTVSSQTVNLTITPDSGYYLTATDFFIGGATSATLNVWTGGNVDPEVTSVTFSDNGTPNTSTNTINVAVALSTFTVASQTDYVNIDIDAKPGTPPEGESRQVCIDSFTTEGSNQTITNVNGGNITSTTTTSVGVLNHSHSGNVIGGITYLVFTKTFTADANYYYTAPGPQGGFSGNPYPTGLYSQTQTNTYNGSNQIIVSVINVYYTPPTDPGFIAQYESVDNHICTLNHAVTFTQDLRPVEVSAEGVNSLVMITGDLNMSGETRSLKVYGNVGETYDLTITDNDGDTYDFTTSGLFSSTATKDDDRAIPTTTGYGGNYGFYEYQIVFPSTEVVKTFDVVIAAGDSTPTMDSGLPTAIYPATPSLRLYQNVKPVITYNTRSLDNPGSYTFGSDVSITAPSGYSSRTGTTDGVSSLSIVTNDKGVGVTFALHHQPLDTDFTFGAQFTLGESGGISGARVLTLAGDDVCIGMRVLGDDITPDSDPTSPTYERYVTVTGVTATTITLSSDQTIPNGAIVTFSPDSSITITDISASLNAGADAITVTATATVNSFGFTNLDMRLNLDNFIIINTPT